MAEPDTPIAWRLAREPVDAPVAGALLAPPGIVTRTRALDGMQKEALVLDETTRACWRFLCDEGPWLNGTDLAPFPLGYFAAGLASSLLTDLAAEAANHGRPTAGLGLDLDIFFSMQGSILRGTMAAGVEDIRVYTHSNSGIKNTELYDLTSAALARRSAVIPALSARLPSRFRLNVNGTEADWPGEHAGALERAADPASLFEAMPAPDGPRPAVPVIRKDAPGPAAEPGVAVGLESNQKRTVHIAADARLRPDGLQEVGARCVHPPGSRFVLLAAGETGDPRAPGGLAYLSAGIAFCFMTQLGRYAQIKKLPLHGYRIVQRTAFCRQAPTPVETAVFLDSDDTVENNRKMVQMGEQTCYVHTTLREPQELTILFGDPPAT